MTESTTTDMPTLGDVMNKLEQWRSNKTHRSDAMPDAIWHDIFALRATHNPNKLRSLFGVTAKQYDAKFAALCPSETTMTDKNTLSELTFCEVQPQMSSKLKVKPVLPTVPLLNTQTIVVEFRRPDGVLMNIHTTTDNFHALLKAFASSELMPC